MSVLLTLASQTVAGAPPNGVRAHTLVGLTLL